MNTIKPGVTFEFEAWAEGTSPAGKGQPTYWSTYVFDNRSEAVAERDRLEKMWKNRTGAGPYKFEVFRIERTLIRRGSKK